MTLDSLPISPPLSAGQSTYSNAHQVRLRQACDGCTAAKVKCDKGRPACQRCLDIDEVCQYSPSRRHGKRAKRSRNSPHETTPPLLTRESGLVPPQPSAAGPECSFTPHSADLFAWDSLDPISSTTETMPAFPSEHEQPDLISNLLMWTNFDSPTSLPSRNPSSCLNAQAPSIEREPSEGDEAMSSDAASWQSFEHPKQETEHALKCEARALDVLKSLQYSPAFCTLERRDSVSAATSNSTTNNSLQRLTCSGDSMDTLLATNKAALGELTRMLECRCADSPHVALLHLTILSKIVFWYRVAVTARYNSQMVDLKPMKIQFGVLDLDDDDYATLHRAILCRELQKASNAIRAFETRFATSAMPVCNKESPWGRPVIRAIREELERSIHEIDRRQIKPF